MLPARSLAVNRTWLVAPHGQTPPQVSAVVEHTRFNPEAVRVWVTVEPSTPESVAVTGEIW